MLNSSGATMVYSTYLGGSASDVGRAIAVRNGTAYVTGQTSSADFPVVNPIKSAPVNLDSDAFVTKVNASGASLDFSTWLGGSTGDQGLGLAVDSSGAVLVPPVSSISLPARPARASRCC